MATPQQLLTQAKGVVAGTAGAIRQPNMQGTRGGPARGGVAARQKPRFQTGGGLIGKPAGGPTSSAVPAEAAISKPMGGKPAWQQLREAGMMPQGSAAANRAAAAGLPGGAAEAIMKTFPGPADGPVGAAVGARPEIAPPMPLGGPGGPGPRPMPGFKPAGPMGVRQMTGGPLQAPGPDPMPIGALPTAIADGPNIGPAPETGGPLPPPPGMSDVLPAPGGGGGFEAMGRIGAGITPGMSQRRLAAAQRQGGQPF